MDTKTMGKNRGERFWLLLSASLAGSGLIFAFVPVFGDVFLMPPGLKYGCGGPL